MHAQSGLASLPILDPAILLKGNSHASVMALACELLLNEIAGLRMGTLAKPLCACIDIRAVLCTLAKERRVSIGRRLCALP
jgi:hypothetical protein